MWTYLRHFFDLKYVFNRVAPVVVDVVTFSWLDYQPIFAKLIPCSLPEKGEAEIQPYVIFDVFLLLSLLLFVCFFVILFRFFFLNVENLVQISVKNREFQFISHLPENIICTFTSWL